MQATKERTAKPRAAPAEKDEGALEAGPGAGASVAMAPVATTAAKRTAQAIFLISIFVLNMEEYRLDSRNMIRDEERVIESVQT